MFVAPLLRRIAGLVLGVESRATSTARKPTRVTREVGWTEYLMVNLVTGPGGVSTDSMGISSGSVTTLQPRRWIR